MADFNLEKSSKKFNIFLGEFLSNLTNTPTIQAISRELFSVRKKDYVLIKNNLSLPELTQNLLDDIIFEKSEILDILNNTFSNKSRYNGNFLKNILDSDLFSAIFSTNYDSLFEDYFFESINKNTPFFLENNELEKIAFYKIFGDLDIPDKFILSTQDIKRIKILNFYETFWKRIRNEFCKNPTILFAVNLEDTVFLDILNFILSKIKKEHQPIYLYVNEPIKSEDAKNFLEEYSINLIEGNYADFFSTLENYFPELSKLEQLSEIEEIISDIENNEQITEEVFDKIEEQEIKDIENSEEIAVIEEIIENTEEKELIVEEKINETVEEKSAAIEEIKEAKEEENIEKLSEITVNEVATEEVQIIEEKQEEVQALENSFPQLPFGVVSTEAVTEEIPKEAETKTENIESLKVETIVSEPLKEREPIFIKLEDKTQLETASEIRFKTLFLDKFPIKFRNFSKTLKPSKITNVGTSDVDFGFEVLSSVQIRLVEYPNFKMLEFKKRDFKFSVGINSEGTILLKSNDLYEYEVYRDTKNNRLRVILEFLKKLFAGTSIKFHLSNVVCDLDFVNHIEEFKFNSILEVLTNYENLVKVYNLHKDKDLASSNNSFFDLFLLELELKYRHIDTWINLKMDNNLGLEEGDRLILIREYDYRLKNLPFTLLEKIELKNSLIEKELINNKIQLNRKTVKISFEKISK